MSRLLPSILMTAILLSCGSAQAESWATKLGFPPDAKVAIINAREAGITWEANLAIQDLAKRGHLFSASVVVPGPWSGAFADWCRKQEKLDVGISVALTNPYSAVHWRLLSSEQGPTSLVDADGLPWTNVAQLAVSASAEDVKRELDAQILRARKLGIQPTHLTGFYGTIYSRPDLAAVLLGASRKYWLPAPLVELTPEMVERFSRQGLPIDKELVELVHSYPFPKLDDIQFVPTDETYEKKREKFTALLKSMPPGLFQIIFRPAKESDGLKVVTKDWQQRVWDAQLLADPDVKLVAEEQKFILTNWRDIMARFEGSSDVKLDDEVAATSETPVETQPSEATE